MDERLRKQLDFMVELEKLKSVYRRNYVVGTRRHENDAEHMYTASLLAVVLFEYAEKDVDQLKVLKMLLVHDLVEVYAGDTFCYDKEGALDKRERELAASEKLFALLPSKQGEELKNLWLEFDDEQTPDAKFAATLDRLFVPMQNLLCDGGTWSENGISRAEVEGRAHIVKESSPKLYAALEEIYAAAEEKGFLSR